LPSLHILHNPLYFPIFTILNHKNHNLLDNNLVTKKFTSYLCQWHLPNGNIFNKWLPHSTLLPWRSRPAVCTHNLTLLTHYYTQNQHRTYTKIITTHFLPTQHRNTKYILPPLALPLIHISNEECHPSRDINTTQPTITITHNQAYLYQDNGKYLLTIPTTRLKWLWTQYHFAQQQPQFLEPPLQPFEMEVIWFY
jgi:hypothetical protein